MAVVAGAADVGAFAGGNGVRVLRGGGKAACQQTTRAIEAAAKVHKFIGSLSKNSGGAWPRRWALMHIYEQEGLTQTELAELMQMGRASLGKLLERLEVKGWIERRADASDSRVRRV
jgi:DNA-binding MarR family transcriptional regulator